MADFNTFSLADIYSKAQAVRSAQQAEQMHGYQLQQLQGQQGVRDRLADFVRPDGSVDTQRAIPSLLKVGDYHSIAALAAMDKAHKEGSGGGSADERMMSTVLTHKMKKENNIPVTPMEEAQARMAYEHLTQPKMGPDGSIMQPRYSAGRMFDQPGGQKAPPANQSQSPYSQNPYSPTPRAVVNPGVKPVERLNKDTNDFSDTMAKNNLTLVNPTITDLNEELKKYTSENVPGLGYAKNLPASSMFLSEQGKIVKQKSQAVANDLLKMYSGLAVTLPEGERRDLEQMKSGAFDAKDFYNAWPTVINRYNSILGNTKAGAAPEVLSEYSKRPGAIKLDPLIAATGKAERSNADAENWIQKAMKQNSGMTRQQIIAEGVKRGKVKEGYR